MNTTLIGALRHVIQLGAGALGATAYVSGEGHEMLVSAAVSVATLVWYAWSNRKAA